MSEEKETDSIFSAGEKLTTEELHNRIILWQYRQIMKYHADKDTSIYNRAVNDLEDAMISYHDNDYFKDLAAGKDYAKIAADFGSYRQLTDLQDEALQKALYALARVKFKALSRLLVRKQITAPMKVVGVIDDETESRMWGNDKNKA